MSTLRLDAPQGRPLGLVAAATSGTLLTPEECARHASTAGPQRSASLVPADRHTDLYAQ
jgi:hypothetical protein